MRQEFRVSRAPWGMGYELRFADLGDGQHISLANPVVMTMQEPSVFARENPPMMAVDEKALQSLMDELWQVGIRPRDIGTAGHLAATQAHLNDFRAIVAKSLDVKL